MNRRVQRLRPDNVLHSKSAEIFPSTKLFWLPADGQFSFRLFRKLDANSIHPRLVTTN